MDWEFLFSPQMGYSALRPCSWEKHTTDHNPLSALKTSSCRRKPTGINGKNPCSIFPIQICFGHLNALSYYFIKLGLRQLSCLPREMLWHTSWSHICKGSEQMAKHTVLVRKESAHGACKEFQSLQQRMVTGSFLFPLPLQEGKMHLIWV